MAVRQVWDGNSDGVTLGSAATSLAGCYGSAVAQAAAITSPATTASTSTTNAFGYTTSTQADALVTAVNSLLTAARNFGLIAT